MICRQKVHSISVTNHSKIRRNATGAYHASDVLHVNGIVRRGKYSRKHVLNIDFTVDLTVFECVITHLWTTNTMINVLKSIPRSVSSNYGVQSTSTKEIIRVQIQCTCWTFQQQGKFLDCTELNIFAVLMRGRINARLKFAKQLIAKNVRAILSNV